MKSGTGLEHLIRFQGMGVQCKVTGSSLGQVRAIATSEISPRRRDAYRLPTPISMLSKVIIFQFSSVFEASEANKLAYGIKTYVQAYHMEQKKFFVGLECQQSSK